METPSQAYPLTWPLGWERSKYSEVSRFGDHSIYKASRRLMRELELLGAIRVVMSTNLRLNKDGTPTSKQRQPVDQGVCVYFRLSGNDQCIPCDRWGRIEDNIHAIALCVEAIRGIDRWGGGKFVNAAFSGFKAIPEKTGFNWRDVLELNEDSNLEDAERNYRQLARQNHPDMPFGSDEKMSELNLAIKEARNNL